MRKYEKALNDAVSLVNTMVDDGTDYGTCLFSLTDRIAGIMQVAAYDDFITIEDFREIQIKSVTVIHDWIMKNKV